MKITKKKKGVVVTHRIQLGQKPGLVLVGLSEKPCKVPILTKTSPSSVIPSELFEYKGNLSSLGISSTFLLQVG